MLNKKPSSPHRLAWYQLLAESRSANRLEQVRLTPRLRTASGQVLAAITKDPEDATLIRLLLKLHLVGDEALLRSGQTVNLARRLVRLRPNTPRDWLLASEALTLVGLLCSQVEIWREGVGFARKAHSGLNAGALSPVSRRSLSAVGCGTCHSGGAGAA